MNFSEVGGFSYTNGEKKVLQKSCDLLAIEIKRQTAQCLKAHGFKVSFRFKPGQLKFSKEFGSVMRSWMILRRKRNIDYLKTSAVEGAAHISSGVIDFLRCSCLDHGGMSENKTVHIRITCTPGDISVATMLEFGWSK